MFKRFLQLLVLFACSTPLIGMSTSYIEVIDDDERTEEKLQQVARITKDDALAYLATSARELLSDEHINTITNIIISLLATNVEPSQRTTIMNGERVSFNCLDITIDPNAVSMVQDIFGMSDQEATEFIEKLVDTLYGTTLEDLYSGDFLLRIKDQWGVESYEDLYDFLEACVVQFDINDETIETVLEVLKELYNETTIYLLLHNPLKIIKEFVRALRSNCRERATTNPYNGFVKKINLLHLCQTLSLISLAANHDLSPPT